MATALERLQHATAQLKLGESLLFLNQYLGAVRGDLTIPALGRIVSAPAAPASAFVVHFLAKQILLNSSTFSSLELNGLRFSRLMDLYFSLDDPIGSDPNWPTADPNGFFERMLAQQMPAQQMDCWQRIGLALGLFRDVGAISHPVTYDIRAALESELGMSVEEFMAMGLLCSAARNASCWGAFDHMYLVKANIDGFHFSRPESWSLFLTRVAIDRDGFRRECSNPFFRVRDVRYTQFEFNPLHCFPVIDIGKAHFLAVDPKLLVERTTLGIFYDLFRSHGTEFTKPFGYVFDRFVGNLLESVCRPDSLWWESDPTRKKPKNAGKVADWAYRGKVHTVLFECKSLRPSVELTTYGSEEEMGKLRERIVSALEQLTVHSGTIRAGKWANHGLHPASTVGVIVTYGRIHSANGPFMRQRVLEDIAKKSLEPIPYVVLSIEELDHVVRLVELGHELDGVIAKLAEVSPNSFDPLQQFAPAFRNQQIMSTYTSTRAEDLFSRVLTVQGRQPNLLCPA